MKATNFSAELAKIATVDKALKTGKLIFRKRAYGMTGKKAVVDGKIFVECSTGASTFFKCINGTHFYGLMVQKDGTEVYIREGKATDKPVKTKKTKAVKAQPAKASKGFDALSVEVFALLQTKGYLSNPVTLGLFTDACTRQDSTALNRVKSAIA